jgi:hypothetical protein
MKADMASTLTRKRRRSSPERRRKVADMTTDELQTMIQDTIEQTLLQWMPDPDAGLEPRPEIIESIERQRKEYAAGKHGKSLDEVAKRLGLD